MSNVLILPSSFDAWVAVGTSPSNVLVLPQLIAPTAPTAPQATPNYVIQYSYGAANCPKPCCVVIAHDANSGWWLQLNDRCPAPNVPNPNGPTFPGLCCIEGQPPGYGSVVAVEVRKENGDFVGWALDLAAASVWVQNQMPAWASDNPVRLDAWGVACCPQIPQQIQPFTKPGQKPPPPPPTCPPGQVWDPITNKCIPVVNPPPPQTCPPGQVWDPITNKCIPVVNPPPPTMQPCWPTPNPEQGDELQDGLNCIEQNLAIIATAIPQIIALLGNPGDGGQPANPDPVTCTQLTAQVALVTAELAQIATNIATAAAAGGPPVDLTAVVSAIDNLIKIVSTFPGAGAANAELIASRLEGISRAISTAPGTDVSGIVDQLMTIAGQGDVPQATLDAMAAQGLISSADLQTLQGAPWSKVISYVTSSAPVRAIEKYITRAGADADTVAGELATLLAPAGNWAEKVAVGGMTFERNLVQAAITPLLTAVLSALKPGGRTSLGVIGVNPDQVIADVATVGINIFIATSLIGLIREGPAEQIAHMAELTLGLLGFEELKEVQIGPLVREGIGLIAERQAKAIFQQELPGTSAMQGYVAMGLMDPTRAKALSLLNGTSDELYPIMLAGAYRGLNPRQMLRLIETGLFSDAQIQDELTFAAMRPVSQARMRQAAPYLATATQRSALLSELQSAAVAGLLSDQDLLAQVDAAESNTDRDQLILSRVHLQQLVAETKALETEYSTLYKAGLMADDLFRANLQAIGLQPFMVNIVAAKAEAQANATLQKQTLAAERALERTTQAKERTAAVNNFVSGNIDAAALLASLLLTGLTAVQAAAWVDLAQLRKSGGLRWIYGLQLSPSAATLLRQRVAALVDQRKRLQITDPQFVAQLQALGIGDRYVNAIQAAADALITPKSSAFAIPVKTN